MPDGVRSTNGIVGDAPSRYRAPSESSPSPSLLKRSNFTATLGVIPPEPLGASWSAAKPPTDWTKSAGARGGILQCEGDAVGLGVGKLEGEIRDEAAHVHLSGAECAASLARSAVSQLQTAIIQNRCCRSFCIQPGIAETKTEVDGVVSVRRNRE